MNYFLEDSGLCGHSIVSSAVIGFFVVNMIMLVVIIGLGVFMVKLMTRIFTRSAESQERKEKEMKGNKKTMADPQCKYLERQIELPKQKHWLT